MAPCPGIEIGRPSGIQTLAPTSASRTASPSRNSPVSSVQHVVEAVPVRHDTTASRASTDLGIDEHRNLVRVPVVDIVRRELEMPAQLAGVDVERDQRARIEVVAFARSSPFQSGPGLPVPQYSSFSSGSYEPVSHVAPAAVLPAVARPGLAARLARRWIVQNATPVCPSSRRTHRGSRGCRPRRR